MELIDYLEEDSDCSIYIKVSKESIRRLLENGSLKIFVDSTTLLIPQSIKKATIEMIP